MMTSYPGPHPAALTSPRCESPRGPLVSVCAMMTFTPGRICRRKVVKGPGEKKPPRLLIQWYRQVLFLIHPSLPATEAEEAHEQDRLHRSRVEQPAHPTPEPVCKEAVPSLHLYPGPPAMGSKLWVFRSLTSHCWPLQWPIPLPRWYLSHRRAQPQHCPHQLLLPFQTPSTVDYAENLVPPNEL